jgi:hypothetical protein
LKYLKDSERIFRTIDVPVPDEFKQAMDKLLVS